AVDVLAEGVDLDARLADHDSRPRGVDVDRDPLRVLADQDVGQARVRELVLDVLADLDVLEQVRRELLRAGVPVRLPVVDDAAAQRSTFSTSRAAARGVNARTVRASGTGRPRMCSATSRALRGDIRTQRATALTSCRSAVSIRSASPLPCGRRNGRGRCAWGR